MPATCQHAPQLLQSLPSTLHPCSCMFCCGQAHAHGVPAQVNIEQLKQLSKMHDIKALPCVSLFRPEQGLLVSFPSVPSRMKQIKANILHVRDSESPFFKLDPNGCVVPTDTDPLPEISKAREEAKKLKASTGGLFEHLMAVSNKCATPTCCLPIDSFRTCQSTSRQCCCGPAGGRHCLAHAHGALDDVRARALHTHVARSA